MIFLRVFTKNSTNFFTSLFYVQNSLYNCNLKKEVYMDDNDFDWGGNCSGDSGGFDLCSGDVGDMFDN